MIAGTGQDDDRVRFVRNVVPAAGQPGYDPQQAGYDPSGANRYDPSQPGGGQGGPGGYNYNQVWDAFSWYRPTLNEV